MKSPADCYTELFLRALVTAYILKMFIRTGRDGALFVPFVEAGY
jgi:hypothetical protein